MGTSGSKGTAAGRGSGRSAGPPRLRRRGSARPFGEAMRARVPRAVACLLLYLTLWGAPPCRVLGRSAWAKAAVKRHWRAITRGRLRPEDLFQGWPHRPSLRLAPEVAMLMVQQYLRRLPGRLLTDGTAWHGVGHELLALGEEPRHHHVPCLFLARVRVLRAAMAPAHNLLLDMVVASMRASGGQRPQDLMAAARFWAVALATPPGPVQCLGCAYLHEDASSLGVAHALFYLARWGFLMHPHPFTHVLGGAAPHDTATTSSPRQHRPAL
ncbi:uncharacterized protein LOC126985743 isoform X2 [Eriocheir sinensis]|uniref:uncharacterized protein LOC126985743 isoform X2 n=1 Tax=Eriocheir sinensis TaxID=95602 RepID=UPI0021C8F31B|nr:uncharacterized protein LOC126985743 isoform X2 [Eriocheir sinensis]